MGTMYSMQSSDKSFSEVPKEKLKEFYNKQYQQNNYFTWEKVSPREHL